MRALLISFCLVFCMPVHAQTGNSLLEDCTGSDEFGSGYCIGFVLGALQGFNGGAAYHAIFSGALSAEEANDSADKALQICVPDGVTNGQLVAVFKKHLENSPSTRHNDANWLLLTAMQDAFPC